MERPYKIVLIVILALLSIQLITNLFFVSPGLKNSIRKLEKTQRHLDSASREVGQARASVDSIQTELYKFNNYILKLEAQADLQHQERMLKEARFKNERDSIQAEISRLRTLADTIELPELTVYDSRKK